MASIKFAIYKNGEDGGFYCGQEYDYDKDYNVNVFNEGVCYLTFDTEEEVLNSFEALQKYDDTDSDAMYELKRIFVE